MEARNSHTNYAQILTMAQLLHKPEKYQASLKPYALISGNNKIEC